MRYYVFLWIVILASACNKDTCKQLACQNGGFCNEGECLCPSGFVGEKCETWVLQRFIGTYQPVYDCMNTQMAVVIEQKPNYFDKLNITSLGDYSCNEIIRLEATVKGDSLFIPLQKVCKQSNLPTGYDFAGKGKIEGDTVSLAFQVNYANVIDFCKVKMARKR